ncbi:MAG: cupredoxin domain-containing protein, partial [Allobranchiibius sp.]
TAAAAPTAAAKITIKNFKYEVPTSVKPGATITVTNSDAVDHTVTSDTKGLFDAVIPGSGGTHTITAPTKPGRYPFHCTYHSNMHGVLVVS